MSSKDSSIPRLVIIEGKDKGKVISLEEGTTIIGRTKGDVILQDPRVSRSHVSLQYDNRSGKLSFTDLKSLNGTLVNGSTAENGVLVDGDRLQIGNTLFDCQLTDATELAELKPAPAPTPAVAKPKPKKKAPELQALDEISEISARKRLEPGLESESPLRTLDENPELSQTKLMSDEDEVTGTHEKRERRRLFAFYPQMSSSRRSILGAVVVLSSAYFLFTSDGPSSDFLRDLTSLKQLEKDGKVAEAIQKAEALSQSYDGDAELFITLGGLYALQNRIEPAIAAYKKAKQINPEHPVATVRLIGLYQRLKAMRHGGRPVVETSPNAQGQPTETEEDRAANVYMQELDEMLRGGKHSRELFIEAANLFLEHKELTRSPEKALILSQALQTTIASDSTIGFKLEAQLMFQQNLPQEAMRVIEKGLQRDSKDEWLLENLAFSKLALKDTAGATEVVESWIRQHPEATKALLVMGYLKYNEKNYFASLPYLQKITQISRGTADPHLPEALFLMGQVYAQQGQTTESKSLFAQACEAGFAQACNLDGPRTPQNAPADSTDEKK